MKDIEIIINGIVHVVTKNQELSYEDIIRMAYGSYSDRSDTTYTVTYSRAHGNKKGLLFKNQSIKVKEGMLIYVTCTNRS